MQVGYSVDVFLAKNDNLGEINCFSEIFMKNKEQLKKIKSKIINQSSLFTIIAAFSSLVNFVTLIVFGRLFSVEEYGAINTLQVVATNIGVSIVPLQMMICKAVASDRKDIDRISDYLSLVIMISVVTVTGMLLGGKSISEYLYIRNVKIYILFMVLVMVNNSFLLFNGFLQGAQHFVKMGLFTLLFYIGKLLLGITLKVMGMGYEAVIVAFLISQSVCVFLMIKEARTNLYKFKYSFAISKKILSEYGWTLLLYIIVSLYTNNGDLILGNIYCEQKQIGLYSVAINLSKIVFFLVASPVATIVLPKIAQKNCNNSKKILYKAELIVLVSSIIYGAMFVSFGKYLISVLYGSDYNGSSVYLVPCVLFTIVLGLFWNYYQYAVATNFVRPFTVITVLFGTIVSSILLYTKADLWLIPILLAAAMILSVVGVVVYKKFQVRVKGICG